MNESRFVYPEVPQQRDDRAVWHEKPAERFAERGHPTLLEMLSLSDWRKFVVETLALLALIAGLQIIVFKSTALPTGMPHPYWLPVLLASCQYGVMGGMFATIAALLVYLMAGLPPQSATQDFYAYAGMAAGQPAAWLATALVLGGLRSLHIHQSTELADRLENYRAYAHDLAGALERAADEIAALERRIAIDTGSVAALMRSLSKIDLSDKRAVAASFCDLFRFGAGASSFDVYLKEGFCYAPALSVENDGIRATTSVQPLERTAVAELIRNSEAGWAAGETVSLQSGQRLVVPIWPSDATTEPLGVVVCQAIRAEQDIRQTRRRLHELCRALGTILAACPHDDCKNPP